MKKKTKKDKVTYTAINQIFDENGMFFIKDFDPYRYTDETENIYNFLFDEDGYVEYHALKEAKEFATQQKCSWDSDIAKYIHSASFDYACKGNYSAVFAWR